MGVARDLLPASGLVLGAGCIVCNAPQALQLLGPIHCASRHCSANSAAAVSRTCTSRKTTTATAAMIAALSRLMRAAL